MERSFARLLVVGGLLVAALGVVFLLAPRIPWLGRLPGDLHLSRGGTTVYLPLATCLILSALLTLAWNLFGRR